MIVPPPPSSAVVLVDAQHGWVGAVGGLLGTADGRTFRVQVRAPIIAISAFDRARAWAITGDGFVLRTTDGQHWRRLGAPHLFHLQFVDPRIGYGMTRDGVLVRSDDAGKSWRQARAPGLVQSECFATPQTGWVARGGSVWATGDAGAHWIRTRLRKGPQEIPDVGCRAADAWVVFHEGAAAGTEGYHVARSLNGSSWRGVFASPFQRRLPSISNYAGPFAPLGHGGAYFTGSCAPCGRRGTATLVRVVDGGVAFARRQVFNGAVPQAVSFVDARTGWVVTPHRLWTTTDGGTHWRRAAHVP